MWNLKFSPGYHDRKIAKYTPILTGIAKHDHPVASGEKSEITQGYKSESL
jgi:hypothetical protein